jgi:hypothetical protein
LSEADDLRKAMRKRLMWILRRQAQVNEQLHTMARELGLDVRVPRMVNGKGEPINWRSNAVLDEDATANLEVCATKGPSKPPAK